MLDQLSSLFQRLNLLFFSQATVARDFQRNFHDSSNSFNRSCIAKNGNSHKKLINCVWGLWPIVLVKEQSASWNDQGASALYFTTRSLNLSGSECPPCKPGVLPVTYIYQTFLWINLANGHTGFSPHPQRTTKILSTSLLQAMYCSELKNQNVFITSLSRYFLVYHSVFSFFCLVTRTYLRCIYLRRNYYSMNLMLRFTQFSFLNFDHIKFNC